MELQRLKKKKNKNKFQLIEFRASKEISSTPDTKAKASRRNQMDFSKTTRTRVRLANTGGALKGLTSLPTGFPFFFGRTLAGQRAAGTGPGALLLVLPPVQHVGFLKQMEIYLGDGTGSVHASTGGDELLSRRPAWPSNRNPVYPPGTKPETGRSDHDDDDDEDREIRRRPRNPTTHAFHPATTRRNGL